MRHTSRNSLKCVIELNTEGRQTIITKTKQNRTERTRMWTNKVGKKMIKSARNTNICTETKMKTNDTLGSRKRRKVNFAPFLSLSLSLILCPCLCVYSDEFRIELEWVIYANRARSDQTVGLPLSLVLPTWTGWWIGDSGSSILGGFVCRRT